MGVNITTYQPNPIVLQPLTTQAYKAGQLYYDSDNDCFTYNNSEAEVSHQIGEEEWVRVRNTSGSTITNGSVVYVNGANSGLPTIVLAQANSVTTTRGVFIATHDIENNTNGFVTALGLVRGLNTNAYSPGTVLYLSESVAGGLTSTVPTYPNYALRLAFVAVQSATVGTIIWSPGIATLDNSRNTRLINRNYTPTAGTNTTNEELLHSLQVGANIVEINDIIAVASTVTTNSTAGTKIFRMYINTSNSLSGATQIAQSVTMSTASTSSPFQRFFPVINNTTLEAFAGTTGPANSSFSTSQTGISANVTVPSLSAGFWILISGQKSVGTDTDTVRLSYVNLQKP